MDISDLLEKILDYFDDQEDRGQDPQWLFRMRFRMILVFLGGVLGVVAAFSFGYGVFALVNGAEDSGVMLGFAGFLGFCSAVCLIIFSMNR